MTNPEHHASPVPGTRSSMLQVLVPVAAGTVLVVAVLLVVVLEVVLVGTFR